MTLDILRMDVTKELLRKMEKEERALFLALGHASNQVNALWKLVIILTNGDTDDPVKQRLEGTQTQVFVRLAIGAMWEAWRLVEDRFLKRPLGREYLPLLDRPATDALERLKKRFGKGSGLSTIRNNYAFHHPGIDDIDAAFEKAAAEVDSEEADWAVYFNKALLNTSFFVSDYVFVHGMADALSEPDVNEAHRKLMGEMAPVANDLSEFAFGFAAAIFRRHVGSELIMTIVAKIDDAPDIDDIRYPFFVETPGLRNA
jgi:fructose-specific component phosphotransferase system IIB-like protein